MIELNDMNNIYYMIWADAILSFRKHNPHISNWQLRLFIFITWMQALNAWIVFLWLKYFGIWQMPVLEVDLFPGNMLDDLTVFSLVFALPFGLLNYCLIFYNNRFKKITERYSGFKYKYALTYSFTMIFGAFISGILYSILT